MLENQGDAKGLEWHNNLKISFKGSLWHHFKLILTRLFWKCVKWGGRVLHARPSPARNASCSHGEVSPGPSGTTLSSWLSLEKVKVILTSGNEMNHLNRQHHPKPPYTTGLRQVPHLLLHQTSLATPTKAPGSPSLPPGKASGAWPSSPPPPPPPPLAVPQGWL